MASKEQAIVLPQIRIGRIEVPVVGDSPLICRRWSEHAVKAMLDTHMKRAKQAKAEKPALQPVVFREHDAFAFKVLDAKKNVLATQAGFADPKAAMAAARAAMETLAAAP